MTEICCIDVTFSLPDWTADARFDDDKPIYYSGGHAWAGQVSGYQYDNTLSRNLFRLKGVTETCLNMQCWVTVRFDCEPAELPKKIAVFQEKLNRFLGRYREAKA